MSRTFLLPTFFLILAWTSQAQEQHAGERLTDQLLGIPDGEGEYEDLYEQHLQIMQHPFDLNRVTAGELRTLHLLSDAQISNFIDYRNHQGTLLAIEELQVIPGFDPSLIHQLLPYVQVSDPRQQIGRGLLRRVFSSGNSYAVFRTERTLETRKGSLASADSSQRFTGSADKIYLRLRAHIPGDYSAGFTGEKDAGERMRFNPGARQYGFDFSSFHVQVQHKGRIKNLIAGDFQAQFGQGLISGGGFGLGKGGEAVSTTRKSDIGFLPYTSVNENYFLRGAGLSVQLWPSILCSVYFSRTRRDASKAHEGDTVRITSFPVSGMHRTIKEVQDRLNVGEQISGGVIRFEKNKFQAGLQVQHVLFEMPVVRRPTPYNQFAFTGTENLNAGLFVHFSRANYAVFAEAARTLDAGFGLIGGLLISLHPQLDLSMLFRRYEPNFRSFYATAFSENTQPQNEQGTYWGLKYRRNRTFEASGYFDLFSFPWLSYRRYAPSSGYEWLMRTDYRPSRTMAFFIQVRQESKMRNLSQPGALYTLAEGVKRQVWINADMRITDKISLKSRIQQSSFMFDGAVTSGVMLLQDVSFSAGKCGFSARHAIFGTDDYENRQFAYERDAWLAYSLPAFAGEGVRNYVLFEYKLHKHVTFWFRFARIRMKRGEEIGTGPDAIQGNIRNDVKFQARFRF